MKKQALMAWILIMVLGCLALFSCRQASLSQGMIIMGQTITVSSKQLNREMIIDIYLPHGYRESTKNYPVLFTCQSHFLHVSGIAADLAWKNSAPELIVASVRNYSSEDFIPEKIEGHPNSGGADRFIAFFKDELIPELDSRYRTQPFRIFYSGSFGGGFCVYALLTQPEAFNAYLAATPAIDYEGGSQLIMNNVQSYLASRNYEGRFLYLGVENDPMLVPVLDKFVDVLSRANVKGLKWEYHPFFDEDHGSIANRVIYHGLKFTYSDWNNIPQDIAGRGVQAIRVYAAGLNKKYGYAIGVSSIALGKVANSYKQQNKLEEAIELLKFNLEYSPNSEMAWLQLGRAYESADQLEKAKDALETAHRKAVENSSPHLGIFIEALEKINQKLAGLNRGTGAKPRPAPSDGLFLEENE
jgi:hypothetical protein